MAATVPHATAVVTRCPPGLTPSWNASRVPGAASRRRASGARAT